MHGKVEWPLIGAHNVDNALAALRRGGACRRERRTRNRVALREFKGVARRMQVRGTVGGIVVCVISRITRRPSRRPSRACAHASRRARILAVLEPRSHTMRAGVHRDTLAPAFAAADEVWLYAPPDLGWDINGVMQELGPARPRAPRPSELSADLAKNLQPGDHVLTREQRQLR